MHLHVEVFTCKHERDVLQLPGSFSLAAQQIDLPNSQKLHKHKCKMSYVNIKHVILYSPLKLQQRSHLFSLSSTYKFCNSE